MLIDPVWKSTLLNGDLNLANRMFPVHFYGFHPREQNMPGKITLVKKIFKKLEQNVMIQRNSRKHEK